VLQETAPDDVAVEAAPSEADQVVEFGLVGNRPIPTATEPRAVVARYRSSTGQLTVEMTSRNPHLHQQWLAGTLELPDHRIRVRAPRSAAASGARSIITPARRWPRGVRCASSGR